MKFTSPSLKERIVSSALKQIEKMLYELDREGKDLSKIKLKKFQKTHHISCTCSKCKEAEKEKNPRLRGMREYGFKVFVGEDDLEE